MNPVLSGATGAKRGLRISSLESLDFVRPRHSPCNWSEGGFINLEEEDAESDMEYDDADAIQDFSSTSGSDSDEDRRGGSGAVDDDRGRAEDFVINSVTRHVAVSLSVYNEYYHAMMRGAARRDWLAASLPTMLRPRAKDAPPLAGSGPGPGQGGQVLQGDRLVGGAGAAAATSDSENDDDSDLYMPTRQNSWVQQRDERHWYRPHLWRERSCLCLPILPPEHQVSMAWGIIMLFVDGVYSAFIVPLTTAFCFHPERRNSWCSFTEMVAGPIFAVNMVLGFHIGFVITCNLRKMYLMRAHLIARFYIFHGGFWLDLLGVLAFLTQMLLLSINENNIVRVAVRLLLIMRIVRVYRILTVMLVASVSQSSGKQVSTLLSSFGMYTMTLLFTGAFFINFFACLFFVIADVQGLEKSWVGRYNSSIGTSLQPPMDVLNAPWVRHWQLGVYYVTTTLVTVGYGDVTPATMAEQLLAIVLMLTAACMFAVLISSMSEALSSLTSDARTGTAVRKKLGEVMQWMQDRNVGAKDRQRIMGYYSSVWRQYHKEHETETQIFEELPAVLRGKVARSLVKQLLGHSLMPSRRDPSKLVEWHLHPAHVELLAERFVPVEVMPGHELFVEGADADSVYLLEEGQLEVWQRESLLYVYKNPIFLGCDDEGNARTVLRSQWIGNSSILGFFNIPNARKRPMRVRAQVLSKLWRLELESLKPIMRTQLEFVKLLIRTFRYNMVHALRNQQVPSAVLAAKCSPLDMADWDPDPSTAADTAFAEVLQWTEFNACMHIEDADPEREAKLARYRRWADQLEKAKTSQIVGLLGKIMRESPIANEVNVIQDAESVANETITNSLAEAGASSSKGPTARPPVSRIRSFPVLSPSTAAANLPTPATSCTSVPPALKRYHSQRVPTHLDRTANPGADTGDEE